MKHLKFTHIKKDAWFSSVRGSYMPVTWQAWLLYIIYAGYSILALAHVIKSANSSLDYLAVVMYWSAGLIAMTWIAQAKS